MATIDIKAQRALIAAKRRELDDWERALDVVERQSQGLAPRVTGPAPTELSSVGFTDAVRIAVTMFGDQEFSVPDIEDLLNQHHVRLPNDPRSRIAMVTKQLADDEAIKRTFEGSGRIPHKYRLVQK